MKDKIELFKLILGGVLFIAFFGIIGTLFYVEVPSPNYELLYILIGIVGAKFSDIVTYFFGSSQGSSDKTKMLINENKKADKA